MAQSHAVTAQRTSRVPNLNLIETYRAAFGAQDVILQVDPNPRTL